MEVRELNGNTIVLTGTKWEEANGYSRAVRRGNYITVTGTVGVEEDGTFANTAELQARRAFDVILEAIDLLGGKRSDIIKTRIFITSPDHTETVGKIHAEYLGDIRPGLTLVVSGLVVKEAMVEIEAEAIVLE